MQKEEEKKLGKSESFGKAHQEENRREKWDGKRRVRKILK